MKTWIDLLGRDTDYPACGKPLQDDVCQNTECDS
jgi:hypothetical protein